MTTTSSAQAGGPDAVFGQVAEMIQSQHRSALVEQAVAELVWHLVEDDPVTERAGLPAVDRNRPAA